MNRTLVGILICTLSLAGMTLLGGCGDNGDTARARIPESRLKPQRSIEDLSPEERAKLEAHQSKLMHEMLIWPDGKGEPRDLDADSAACRDSASKRRDIANANPLVKMTWNARCMAEKGWVLNPNAEIPQR
jgi:hypothetical protein